MSIHEQFLAVTKARNNAQYYLDNAAMTQTPTICTEAMNQWYEALHSNVHRSAHSSANSTTIAYEAARTTLQKFIHAKHADEIIFTKNCTEAMNIVADSWGLKNLQSTDTIAVTIAEHHSSIVPWQKVAKVTGCTIEWIPVTPTGHTDTHALETLLKTKTVKAVIHTGLSNVLGVVNDVATITSLAHKYGALSIVDAAQLIAHSEINVERIDCDFLVCSGYKMYGPTGIGILYGKQELLTKMPSFMGGGMMVDKVTTEGYTDAMLPYRFEAGTPPIAAAIGLAASIEWLQLIDRSGTYKAESALLEQVELALRSMPTITVLGEKTERANCLSFYSNALHAHDLADLLSEHGIAVRTGTHCTQPLHTFMNCAASVRVSVGMYTTEQDIAALLKALHVILQQLT